MKGFVLLTAAGFVALAVTVTFAAGPARSRD
jgi:hypothetical protein